MQNTLPLTPGNPLKSVQGLARQIALPGEHAPLRFPSFPALERTAVVGFNQPASLTLTANTDIAVTVFRQATYPVWADIVSNYCAILDYTTTYNKDVATAAASMTVWDVIPVPYSYAKAGRTATANAIGISGTAANAVAAMSYQPPLVGIDAGQSWFYVPRNCNLRLVAAASSLSTGGYVVNANFQRWLEPGAPPSSASVVVVEFTIGASFTGFMSSVALGVTEGWYKLASFESNSNGGGIPRQFGLGVLVTSDSSITYTSSASDAGSLTAMTLSSSIAHLPLVQPTEFNNSALPWYAARVTASAILGTNVSQVLNKGGTVLGGRVSPTVQNAWSVTKSYINGLHPAEKAYLPLETGVYTYCPPSTDLVFFTDYVFRFGDGSYIPSFALNNDSMYNKMYIRAAAVDEQLACTATWHIEFRTSSALFQVGLSGMTLESLHTAQLVLAANGFFFENPWHDKLLGKIIAAASKYGPSLIGMVNPTAGYFAQRALDEFRPAPGPSKPAATSARSSGITAQPKTRVAKAKPVTVKRKSKARRRSKKK